MNRHFTYDNIELWQDEKWTEKLSPLYHISQWLGNNEKVRPMDYPVPEALRGVEDLTKLPIYHHKTSSIILPEVVEHWREKGVRLNCWSLPGPIKWMTMVPEKAMEDRGKKLPILLVYHHEHYEDPFFNMRNVEYFKDYNEMVTNGNLMIVYIITNHAPDILKKYSTILSEALTIFPGDMNRIYLDISVVLDNGAKLADIPGFKYTDDNGEYVCPDDCIEYVGHVPVINMGRRWPNKYSLMRNYFTEKKAGNDEFVDRARTVHSLYGKRMMEGIVLEHRYETPEDPELLEFWRKMGIKYEAHDCEGERWITMTPLCAFDEPEKKLPLVVIMYEVNYFSDHFIINSFSSYHEYCKLAAMGEMILLFFARENPEDNEMLIDILDEVGRLYPIDTSRVYITGHSHNSVFSTAFMLRHPDRIAAVATHGNPGGVGLRAPKNDFVVFDLTDAEVDKLSTLDMPYICLGCLAEFTFPGITEAGRAAPDETERAIGLQRRMKANNLPVRSLEEIKAARFSPDKAIRMLCIPGDHSETVFFEGMEHYIVDIKNNDGKDHFRIVGVENFMHMPLPSFPIFAWSFLRRFARDQKTGELIELF